jgi:uncharacterized protein (DUF2147 family)
MHAAPTLFLEDSQVSLKIHNRYFAPILAIAVFAAVFSATSAAIADLMSPVGNWKTVDDATGKVNSKVVLWVEDGKLYGRIQELINPDPRDSDPRCRRCTGAFKNKSLVGLQILWDLRKNGDQWSGGQIVDPDNGKVYKCSIMVTEGGRKLKVRGFIGFSLLGRTEYWLRDE